MDFVQKFNFTQWAITRKSQIMKIRWAYRMWWGISLSFELT